MSTWSCASCIYIQFSQNIYFWDLLKNKTTATTVGNALTKAVSLRLGCCPRSHMRLQPFPQTVQVYGNSPVFICLLWFAFRAKLLSQTAQVKGLSPVWVCMCVIRLDFWLQHFPQIMQANTTTAKTFESQEGSLNVKNWGIGSKLQWS